MVPVVVVTVVAIAVVLIVLLVASGGSQYEATIREIVPHGADRVTVRFHVKNLGSAPATPTCQVDLSSPSGAVTGDATLKPDQPIPVDLWETYNLEVEVTPGGASRVQEAASRVNCA